MEAVRDVAELVLRYRRDTDYRIIVRDLGAAVTVASIHGGGIDPLTSELAVAVAGDDSNLYDLQGIRPSDNAVLRVPASRFDDMRLLALLGRSRLALSVLGAPGSEAAVHLGGRNRRLREILEQQLSQAGFTVKPPSGALAAHHPDRFHNQPAEGGVQLELTEGLRQEMVGRPLRGSDWQNPATWKEPMHRFVECVRAGVQQYLAETRDDAAQAVRTFDETTRTIKRAWRSSGLPHPPVHDDEADQ